MFKVIIHKDAQRTQEKVDEHSEKLQVLNTEKNIKKNQTEMKNIITEMKNTLEGFSSDTEIFTEMIMQRNCQLGDRVGEITQAK